MVELNWRSQTPEWHSFKYFGSELRTCAEKDSRKLPELLSRLEDAILLRQTELTTSADHRDEQVAMRIASIAVPRMKTHEMAL